MSKKTSLVSIIAIVVCGLIFASSLGYYFYQKNNPAEQIIIPSDQELNNVDKDPQGILANISGADLEKIDVKRGVAIYKDTVYFVRNKTEAEIRADIAKQTQTQAPTTTPTKTTPDKTTTEPEKVKIDANAYSSSQLMSWSAKKGISLVSDLSNADEHPVNRLSSFVENDSLSLFPCIPSQNTSIICETSKVYQYNLNTSKLALVTDVSSAADKETQIKTLNQKYHFDDLGQPFWQDIQGDTLYGIKNTYKTEKSNTPVLQGSLTTSKDGISEKPLVVGTQLARADLKINTKGNILIDQSGTLKASNSCVTEHRLIEINPNKPSEQKKDVVRKLALDDKGAWNDGVVRPDADQKTWSDVCANLPEYKGKTPAELLEINSQAEAKIQALN
jgi:hypothetical protein